MKTVQMTIDEPLLDRVDQVVRELDTTRSAFVRDALELALRQHRILALEKRQAEGYAKHPVQAGEFDVWTNEQSWGDL